MFEELIAQHCAPALAGIKPSNIVSCLKCRFGNIRDEVDRLNREMNRRGIYFEVLCECGERILLMVYRQNKLEAYLGKPEIRAFLTDAGYPGEFSLAAYLECLKHRLGGEVFPHEIGAFLGYPLHDIYGFINNEPCLFVGDWKVYGDEEHAKKIFARCRMCKYAVWRRVHSGKTLAQLFAA